MPSRAKPSVLGVFICIALVGVKLAFDKFYPGSVPGMCGDISLCLAAIFALVTMYIYYRANEPLTSAILAVTIAASIGAGLGYFGVWYGISSFTSAQKVVGTFQNLPFVSSMAA